MMARMKRSSTPDALAAASIPANRSFISSAVLSGYWNCRQDMLKMGWLLLNLLKYQ